MSAIRGKDTKPEIALRRLLHASGYRYVLHAKALPGRPDIVFPARRKAVEIRGCFFHRHGCANSVLPKTRREWWSVKLDDNVARDARNVEALREAGWDVLIVWECEIRADVAAAAKQAAEFLGPPGKFVWTTKLGTLSEGVPDSG